MSGGWKQTERVVAGWFGTVRNPLSGRNNVDDSGARRLGDIVYKHAVVEIKRHKTVSMINVPCVRDLARKAKLPWALFEFKTGAADLVKLTVNKETAAYLSECLNALWTSKQGAK